MFIVFGITSKGTKLYWTGFDVSSHRSNAATYSSERIAKEAIERAGRHYPLLKFESEAK